MSTGVQEEVTVDFSEEELDHLCAACGVQPPPGLEPPALPPEVRDAVRSTVERSLRARQLLGAGDAGTWAPMPTIAHVVTMLARPSVAAKAALGRPGQGETRRYGLLGPVGVEQRPLPAGLHRLTLFEAEELLDRVLGFLGRPSGPQPEAAGFHLPGGDLRQILRLATAGDLAAVQYVLRSTGVPRPAAAAFSRALRPEIPLATFEVTYRAPDGLFRGGELMWIDDPDNGVWTMPPLVDGPATVEVTPASPDSLIAELRSYLPAGLTAAPVG